MEREYPTGTTTVTAPEGATCDLCGPPWESVPATLRITSEVYFVDVCEGCFHTTERELELELVEQQRVPHPAKRTRTCERARRFGRRWRR